MKIYLEYKDLKSEKFWEVTVKGKVMTTRWGKLDTQGQSKSKESASPKLAKAEAEKQKASKIKKGYKAVTAKKRASPKQTPVKKLAAKKKRSISIRKSFIKTAPKAGSSDEVDAIVSLEELLVAYAHM
tara:strand:+ start:292 stop:675 length:384 start_codon:yes stop_codon:yes gene_type:complete